MAKKKKSDFYEDIVNEVNKDYQKRQLMRRPYELAWQLNMNFLMGNQYCAISARGAIEQEDKNYYWQEKQVFNHIAPIIEARLARLKRVRPKMTVRPFSGNQDDISSAKTATKVLQSVSEKLSLDGKLGSATAWSEVTGTVFYKIIWDETNGDSIFVNNGVRNLGDVNVTVVPPFEIYPDSNVAADIDECGSIIHAKVYSAAEVEKIWGEKVKGGEIKVFSMTGGAAVGGYGYNSVIPSITSESKNDHVVVIEKYVKPCDEYPDGQLIIVAGDKLLHYGELPFVNQNDGKRGYPFVRQVAHEQVGCFWGASVIERIIPVQRSYNAVKNRKHEFLNRLAMGVLTVEDGSVDTNNLEEEGLSPGKILVYRQGAEKPNFLAAGNVPADFSYEEDRLLNEFVVISGVSEISRNSATPTNITSGVALQILVEQDDTRLSATAENIRFALKEIAKNVLRLYKQYAVTPRLLKIVGENEVELYYFSASDINSDDVVLDTENELNDSPASRKNMVLELLRTGVLYDKNGKLSENTKVKILEMMGLGNWENACDLIRLNRDKAEKENLSIKKAQELLDVDDHAVHIETHTAFVISGEAKKLSREEIILEHICAHKARLAAQGE
ncbi:MAG TPA: hypothetical protein P5087_01220 [Eubacteriales bacterium]|nr:hypothetical protein [Eubacteriales bacterium]